MGAMEKHEYYTYEDYYSWETDVRCELIEGVPVAMAAPGRAHQTISRELNRQFSNFLFGKTCEVFAAAFDVRLNPEGADDTVVQPDLLVVCDPAKLEDDRGCKGAPDLVIEILSQSTLRHDTITKLALYKKAGVREIWLVDPCKRCIDVHFSADGTWQTIRYKEVDIIPVKILEGCEIILEYVFQRVPRR